MKSKIRRFDNRVSQAVKFSPIATVLFTILGVVVCCASSSVVVHTTNSVDNTNTIHRILQQEEENDVMGSCTYKNPWSGTTCMEFRSNIASSTMWWNLDNMQNRCDKETDSTLTAGEGCFLSTESLPADFAGWCIKDVSDESEDSMTTTEATSMMVSAMADCAMNKMACEQFVVGIFNSALSDCGTSDSEKPKEDDMSGNSGNGEILIESFDDPKLLWEMYATSDMMKGYENNKEYEYDNEYEWDYKYAQSGEGSFEIIDGVMVVTSNITSPLISSPVEDASFMRNGLVSLSARSGAFPDVSSCKGLKMIIKTNNDEEYNGYKVDFGYKKLPEKRFAFGYRTNLTVPNNDEFMEVMIPFENFTLDWDFDTGKQLSSCIDNEEYCPDEATLKNMETVTIMAGWIDGYSQLHIKSIHASGCDVVEETEEKDHSPIAQWTCSSNSSPTSDEIMIESFSTPSLDWMTMNDPVMGGESYSDMYMEDGTAVFSGEVKDVPFLGVPGFIQMESRGGAYPDVSCCSSLKLNVMGMEEYEGYRVSFGTKKAKNGFFAMGFKADFDAPIDAYGNVVIPFDMFSVEWDEATGDQVITCAEDPTVCPDEETLRNMKTIALWGEGVGGMVNLHVKSISAVGCEEPDEVSSKSSSVGRKGLHRMLFCLFSLTSISFFI